MESGWKVDEKVKVWYMPIKKGETHYSQNSLSLFCSFSLTLRKNKKKKYNSLRVCGIEENSESESVVLLDYKDLQLPNCENGVKWRK